MRKSIRSLFAAAVIAAAATVAFAGGFFLELGNPDASPQARARNAVVTLRAVGCGEPAKALVTGTAIGVVNGKRQSIPLSLFSLKEPGMHAVTQQWPAEGQWVLQFVAKEGGRVTSTLVPAEGPRVDRARAKWNHGEPSESDLNAMLASVTQQARQ
jgi:hypothetical protein